MRSMWLPEPLILEYPKTSQSPPCSHRDTGCPQSPPPVQGKPWGQLWPSKPRTWVRDSPLYVPLPSPRSAHPRGLRDLLWTPRIFSGAGEPQDFSPRHPEGQPGITPAEASPAQPQEAGERGRVRATLEDTGACWDILGHAGVFWGRVGCTGVHWDALEVHDQYRGSTGPSRTPGTHLRPLHSLETSVFL